MCPFHARRTDMTRYARHFRKVARNLSHIELTRQPDDGDDLSDLASTLQSYEGRTGPTRFLDFYGVEGIRTALERYGIISALERRGYANFEFNVARFDEQHVLAIEAEHANLEESARILELAVRRDGLVATVPVGLPPIESRYDVLTIDWLHLSNPAAAFHPDRPRLPGQRSPGLGIGERVLELLYRVVHRLDLHAIVTVGEYFHNAYLYAQELPFFDPYYAGQLDALADTLLRDASLSLAQASWAIRWGYVICDDAPFVWRGEAQIWPRAPSLARYLNADTYHALRERHRGSFSFALNHEDFAAHWERLGADPLGPPAALDYPSS